MKIRTIGDSFVAMWVGEDGLVKKISATRDRPGATFNCEVSPGQWRSWPVPGTRNVVFTEVGQLVPFIRMMRKTE